jgi:hypothetical protein
MTDRKIDGIVMFSGGLDSSIAVHMLKSQGLSVLALHFVLPFYSGIGRTHDRIRSYAGTLGIPLRIIEEGEEFFAMVQSPAWGFGKNANPCLDCRIHRLKRAKSIMEETGAAFIATGEVIGQRPKSQRRECFRMIEKQTGLDGRLLRPLCARLLPPTIAEEQGLVDREKLFSHSGRGRFMQLAYAQQHGIGHSAPAGGCLLTDVGSSRRYLALAAKYPDIGLEDFKLIAWGRHFAIGERSRIVIARNDRENGIFEHIISTQDLVFDLADAPGPMGIGRGVFTDDDIRRAASFVARYSRSRGDALARVRVYRTGETGTVMEVVPADPADCEGCRL